MSSKKLLKSKKNVSYNGDYIIMTVLDQYDFDDDGEWDQIITTKDRRKNPSYKNIKKSLKIAFPDKIQKVKLTEINPNVKILKKYKKALPSLPLLLQGALKNKIESDSLSYEQMIGLLGIPETTFRNTMKGFAQDQKVEPAYLKRWLNGEIDLYRSL